MDLHSDRRQDDILATGFARSNTKLSLGVVDGRNIWINDFEQSLSLIRKAAESLGAGRLWIAPSCSLLHVPCDLELETDDPYLYRHMGDAALALDERVKAVEAYRMALERTPRDLVACQRLIECLFVGRQYEEAVQVCRHALSVDARCYAAYAWMGRIFRQLQSYTAAREAFEKAIMIRHNLGYLHRQLGSLHEQLKEPFEAMEAYEAALRLDEEDGEAVIAPDIKGEAEGHDRGEEDMPAHGHLHPEQETAQSATDQRAEDALPRLLPRRSIVRLQHHERGERNPVATRDVESFVGRNRQHHQRGDAQGVAQQHPIHLRRRIQP